MTYKKTEVSWCKDLIPELYTVNKMILARNGNIPIKAINFIGNKKDVDFVIKNEGDLLNGIKYENLDPNKNAIDIIVPEGIAKFDYSRFTKLLGFENLSNDDFHETLIGISKDVIKELENIVTENVFLAANNTLICHFSKYDDNNFHIEDLDWLKKNNNIKEEITETEQANTNGQQSSRVDGEDKQLKKDSESKENVSSRTAENTSSEKELNENVKNINNIISEDKSFVPEPSEKKIYPYKIKESLTDEEIEANNDLLQQIKQVYAETIKFIEDTCNASYRIILNKMQESLDTLKFDKQFCVIYMELSNDYSTELYKRLYQLDKVTEAFNEKVVHLVVNLGCPYCRNTWDEDITFAPVGPQFIRCPSCFTERPFEKQ